VSGAGACRRPPRSSFRHAPIRIPSRAVDRLFIPQFTNANPPVTKG
jgi:hypothetical protein